MLGTELQRDNGVKLSYLRAQTSEKELATPPSGPDVGTIGHNTPPGKLRPLTKVISKRRPCLQHRMCRGHSSDRFLFAGYMRGDLRAPDASESIRIERHRIELQPLQD